MKRFRIFAAILLLIGLGVFFIASGLIQVQAAVSHWSFNRVAVDDPLTFAKRLGQLLDYLPANGTVGYLSELDFPGLSYNPIDTDEEFVMTQYYLVPRIIVQGASPDLVIVNIPFHTSKEIDQLTAPLKIHQIHDFGYGIYLYQH